jgi:DNA mismatch endonuclease, patch repair protein
VLRALPRDNVIHAYLRWRYDGRTVTKSLGRVNHSTRMANLEEGWQRARDRGLVHDEENPTESWASSSQVRASMRANRGRDTAPERRLRSLLHAQGLRYRVSTKPVPNLRRTADIVFPKARVAVFVDGCYWHGCPEHHRPAKVNSEFWRRKISDNQRRDVETTNALMDEGWTVIRCWEHEDPRDVADRVIGVLADQH